MPRSTISNLMDVPRQRFVAVFIEPCKLKKRQRGAFSVPRADASSFDRRRKPGYERMSVIASALTISLG